MQKRIMRTIGITTRTRTFEFMAKTFLIYLIHLIFFKFFELHFKNSRSLEWYKSGFPCVRPLPYKEFEMMFLFPTFLSALYWKLDWTSASIIELDLLFE